MTIEIVIVFSLIIIAVVLFSVDGVSYDIVALTLVSALMLVDNDLTMK